MFFFLACRCLSTIRPSVSCALSPVGFMRTIRPSVSCVGFFLQAAGMYRRKRRTSYVFRLLSFLCVNRTRYQVYTWCYILFAVASDIIYICVNGWTVGWLGWLGCRAVGYMKYCTYVGGGCDQKHVVLSKCELISLFFL